VPAPVDPDRGGDTTDAVTLDVDLDLAIEWAVPGVALAFPAALTVLLVAGQAAGGVVWLPMIRRHLGNYGRRRRAA
jgi:hypothetical protein